MAAPKPEPLDLYFMDARSKLIDVAAFMDRIEKSGNIEDYRYQAFLKALSCLGSSDRAESVLRSFSDPTEAPAKDASAGPANGAWEA